MDGFEIEFYESAAKNFRGTAAQVGWGERGQRTRHLVIGKEIKRLQGLDRSTFAPVDVILDFGCGKADLYKLLRRIEVPFTKYIGVEAIQESIEDAREAYGDNGDFELIEANWSPGDDLPEFDVAIICGSLSTTPPETRGEIIMDLARRAKVGLIVSMIRPCASATYDPLFYPAEPGELIRLFDPDTWRLSMRADYLPHDFMLTICGGGWPL